MKILLTSLVIFISLRETSYAQTKPQTCYCSTLFKEAVQKVSTIYAGFQDKVTHQTRGEYNRLVSRLQTKAANITGERACYEVIKLYTDWLNDGHVGVWFGLQSSPARLRKVQVKDLSGILKASNDNFEGMWSKTDQRQRYAVIKDPSQLNKFIAVTMKSSDSAWKPGMVKVEFYGYDNRDKLYRHVLSKKL